MTRGSLPGRRRTLTLVGLVAVVSMVLVFAVAGTRDSHAAGAHEHGAAAVVSTK